MEGNRSMKRVILAAAISLVLSACGTPPARPIDSKLAAGMKDQSLVYVTRAKPHFNVLTPGAAAFGVIGALATMDKGNSLVAADGIEDPAASISRALAQALATSRGAVIQATPLQAGPEAVEALKTGNATARFVLDVQTRSWGYSYFPTDWTHYRVMYVAKAVLFDTQSRTVVAEATCKRIPDSNANAPREEELVANSSARLKSELATAAEECVKTLKSEMLQVS
jgi:hypothetical protein